MRVRAHTHTHTDTHRLWPFFTILPATVNCVESLAAPLPFVFQASSLTEMRCFLSSIVIWLSRLSVTRCLQSMPGRKEDREMTELWISACSILWAEEQANKQEGYTAQKMSVTVLAEVVGATLLPAWVRDHHQQHQNFRLKHWFFFSHLFIWTTGPPKWHLVKINKNRDSLPGHQFKSCSTVPS